MDDDALFRRLDTGPDDTEVRLVYADWLDERGRPSAARIVRVTVALRSLEPDHPHWTRAEQDLAEHRAHVEEGWLQTVLRSHLQDVPEWGSRGCSCLRSAEGGLLHRELQDRSLDVWRRLEDRIREAIEDEREEFRPLEGLDQEQRAHIHTLPESIGELRSLTNLQFYGSVVSRLPPQIGQLAQLRIFTPYTSYRLHWYPYEITRCTSLRDSTVSTRASYGNVKNRIGFPALRPRGDERARAVASDLWGSAERRCAACDASFVDEGRVRRWISLRVATDVLPLLANLCSEACADRLPEGAEGQVREAHRGGASVQQPPKGYRGSIR